MNRCSLGKKVRNGYTDFINFDREVIFDDCEKYK